MKQYVIWPYYRIVQERKPPTARQLKKLEEWRKQATQTNQGERNENV